MYLLIFSPLSLYSSLSLFFFLFLAVPLAYLAVMVWWRYILSAFFCLGNSISPSILIESIAEYSSLGCRPLLFITWNISCLCLLACSVSVEKSASSLMGVPLYVTSCFSLPAFKILSLENQDGGVGRYTAPPRTTRTDRELNCKGVRHQGNKK